VIRGSTAWSLGVLLLFSLGCRGEKTGERGASRARPRGPVGQAARKSSTAIRPSVCEEPRVLRLPVRKGDYVHFIAEQGARDVAVTLFGPGGRRLLTVDSVIAAEAPWPAEEVHWVADAPGELRLEVELLQGPSGPCPLRLVAQRPATAADRERSLAEAALALAHALRRTHEEERCREGVAPYQRAERLFLDLGLPRRRAEALFNLGVLAKDCLRDNPAALLAFTRAEPLFVGDDEGEAKVHQNLGEIRFNLGDLDGAIREYRRALELHRRLGNRTGEALASSNLGHALDLRGRYDESAVLFDVAMALWQESDDPGLRAKTFLNRGQLHRELGETERAGERFREARALYRQANDRATARPPCPGARPGRRGPARSGR